LKAAAVARLCQRADIWRSMPDMCAQYWPAGQPYPAGVYVAAPVITMSATSGVVRVVDGRDGREKDCLNYSYGAQKCYHWLGEGPRKKKQTVANVQAPHRITVKPKAEKTPVPEPRVEPARVEAPNT
jgi:hypothetical protein